jgi:hypothetical protein
MKQEMVMISRPLVEQLIVQLDRSAHFCENARSMTDTDLRADFRATEPTEYYSGASGYARATMRDVVQVLETHLN